MKGVTPTMKKSHEYDSPVLSRLVSVVTVFAICICSICCIVTASKVAQMSTGGAAVQAPAQQQSTPSQNSNPGTQDTTPGTTPENPGTQDTTPENPGAQDTTPAPEQPAGPSKEEILKKYTEVMNQLKGGVATYEKKEFQVLQDDYDLGTVGNLVLPIAKGLMTSEEDADLQKREDMEQIPVIRNTKGCLLTDVSAIKTATMKESGGKTTIEIVLNDEKNPLPAAEGATSCDSIVGSMFNPLSKAEIDDIVAQFSAVVKVDKFDLTGKDCTATLVFDTASGKVESLVQVMNYYIEVDATAVIVPVSGYATLTNRMTINNVTYK